MWLLHAWHCYELICFVEKNLDPSRDDVKKAINKNICRCTGYKKIIDSVLQTAKILREKQENQQKQDTKIGSRAPKYKSEDTVLGLRPFVCDISKKDMKYGALKFSDYPRAKIVKIDIEEAKKTEGVIAVYTAKDVLGDRNIGLIKQDWKLMIAQGEITNYIGDVLATVVANSEEIARSAVEKIKVEYEELEAVTTIEQALKEGAPLVCDDCKNNILSKSELSLGDTKKAFANAKYISKGVYKTQRIEHAFIEPECCVAMPIETYGEKGLIVYSQSQGVYEDRKQIAKITGLKEQRINVIQVETGGAFGGKEDLTVQGHASLCALLSGFPTQVKFTRQESMFFHPKRHPMTLDYKLACDENGILTALECDIVADTGAYASVGAKVVERAAGHATGAYQVLNVDIKAKAVHTNNVPCGAMRGFGVNQACFAMEGAVEDLCKQGGFDSWEFRYKNALEEGKKTATGQILGKGCGLKQTLLAIKKDYKEAKSAGLSTGLACGIKNTGVGNGMPDVSNVKIIIKDKQNIEVYHGWTEMGQGVHTMAQQAVCQELEWAKIENIKVINETNNDVITGMTTSSRGTSLLGNAIIQACKKIKADLQENKEIIGKTYKGSWVCDWTTDSFRKKKQKNPITHYSYGFATQCVILEENAQIKKVIASHDAGKVMNPTLFEGQIEGAVHMGLGYAISENCEWENGFPKTNKFAKLGVLRAKETPQIEVIPVESNDPFGPYGAKGVGEIGLVPTAGAVANAFYNFDGIKRMELPIKNKTK